MLSSTRSSSSIHLEGSKSAPTRTMLNPSQSSGSLGSLATDRSKEVQLTRFNPLQAESSYDSLVTRCTTLSENADTQDNNIARKPIDKFTNKLWSIAQHGRHVSGGESDIASSEHPDACEPFKLIWTNLSFEVELSTYDKLVNRTSRALSRVRSFREDKARRTQRNIMSKQTGGHEKTLHSLEHQQSVDQVEPVMDRQLVDKRNIFSNLNGYINSGELTAILGPSGAGKTSLLNAICGRTQNYAGRIRLVGAGNRPMRLSMIPQKDFLIENLTVRENLLYSSRLLNPEAHFDHRANIARVVRMLNLAACLDSPAANVSGGEYKRVSIGQELLRQPDILVLDEPTSGLDSLNCRNLIGSLVQLARTSRDGLMRPIAIVMTIHQPDVEVFHMFDHVYCMARGGRVVYDGHPHEAMRVIRSQANLIATAEEQPLVDRTANESGTNPTEENNNNNDRSCLTFNSTMFKNPANLLIEIASGMHGAEPIERLSRYQLKHFEQLHRAQDSGSAKRKTLSQLQVNMLAGQSSVGKRPESDELHKRSPDQSLVSAHSRLQSSGAIPSAIPSAGNDKWSLAGADPPSGCHQLQRDKRLNAKTDHSGLFWYHSRVLTQRAFVSTLRDPLMTLISLLFHLSIPFVMWTVYPKKIGHTHGCPLSQRELDMVSMASNRTAAKLEDLQEQVTTTLECSTMFFLTTYSFSMCSLSVAALAFPLNMHILLKEVRNGWYNLTPYVLAKTLANLCFEVLFPVISLVMIYVMLGMPSSYLQWRLWSMALVMALVSMISHTQGLIFGALCMDSVQTAIFLASASSLPQTLLSGFTARIKHMPWLLQRLSWLSQYRYSSDLINMIRFGFNTCPCDHTTDEYLRSHEPEFRDVPSNLKPMFIYYLVSHTPTEEEAGGNETMTTTTTTMSSLASNSTHQLATGLASLADANATTSSLINGATQLAIPGVDHELMLNYGERLDMLKRMESGEVDLFGRMASMISRSFSFGRQLDGCHSVRSQILVTAGTPDDQLLPLMLACMLGLLLVGKLLLFLVVRSKIGSRI